MGPQVNCRRNCHFNSNRHGINSARGHAIQPPKHSLCAPSPPMDAQPSSARFLDVVELLLQQSDLPKRVKDYCHLLQTSAAVAAAAQRCRGLLEVKVHADTPPRAAAVAPWLVRHGACIGSLVVDICPDRGDATGEIAAEDRAAAAAGGAVLINALQQAAAHQPNDGAAGAGAGPAMCGLLLPQRLQLMCLPETAPRLVQLAGRQATWLSLDFAVSIDEDTLADRGPSAAAVAALPNLRQLQLNAAAQGVLPALPGCSSSSTLTRLELELVGSRALMQALPTQLRSLKLHVENWSEDWQGAWLPLQHHTALTELDVQFSGDLVFGSDDVLPASLETLEIDGLPSVTPLLGLQQLRRLSLTVAPPDDLLQLSQLSKLTHIKLTSFQWCELPSLLVASEAWSRLSALQQLTLWTSSQPVLHNLSKATSITRLDISLSHDGEDASLSILAQPLAAALSPLTKLQELSVSAWHRVSDAGPAGALEASMAALGAAIVSLPCLQMLGLHTASLYPMPLGDVALQLVNAGTQLTALDISGCRPMVALQGIIRGLGSQLRLLHLWIDDNDVAAPADCLAVVARHARMLTQLQLSTRSDLTPRAVGQLGRLPKLERLVLVRQGWPGFQHSASEFWVSLVAAGLGLLLEVDNRR